MSEQMGRQNVQSIAIEAEDHGANLTNLWG
jgi:hypothetical protein